MQSYSVFISGSNGISLGNTWMLLDQFDLKANQHFKMKISLQATRFQLLVQYSLSTIYNNYLRDKWLEAGSLS